MAGNPAGWIDFTFGSFITFPAARGSWNSAPSKRARKWENRERERERERQFHAGSTAEAAAVSRTVTHSRNRLLFTNFTDSFGLLPNRWLDEPVIRWKCTPAKKNKQTNKQNKYESLPKPTGFSFFFYFKNKLIQLRWSKRKAPPRDLKRGNCNRITRRSNSTKKK